jgi:phosphate:Na+ symporter
MITVVVQSSSVTMALTLSALHVSAISLPIAAAIYWGRKPEPPRHRRNFKKANRTRYFLFNLFVTIFAYLLLHPYYCWLPTFLYQWSSHCFGPFLHNNKFRFNYHLHPLLDKFIHFLERFFKESDGAVTAFIGHATIAERLTALDLFKRETNYFIHNSMLFNLELFNSNTRYISENSDYKSINVKKKFL